MYDRNHISKLTLECGIEVRAALNRRYAEAVCKFGEDADVAVIFDLETLENSKC